MYRTDAHEDRSLLLLGHDRKIVAVRRDSGEVAWTFQYDEAYGYYVDFAVTLGRVYVAAGPYLACLDYKTGRPHFSTQFKSPILRVLLDDQQLFAFGDKHIGCVDLDGRLLWEQPHEIHMDAKAPTFGFPGNIIGGFRDSG
jgi:outer membrane protein assembly factor BamB